MSQRYFTAFLLAAAVLAAVQFPGNAQTEPSAAVAKMWWPEQYNVWTPVSWPDHYFKFNVFYNGSVVLSPSGAPWKPHSHKWIGQDYQLHTQGVGRRTGHSALGLLARGACAIHRV